MCSNCNWNGVSNHALLYIQAPDLSQGRTSAPALAPIVCHLCFRMSELVTWPGRTTLLQAKATQGHEISR